MSVKIELADCMNQLPLIESESVDAVITDPPYGASFRSNRSDTPKAAIINDESPFIWFLPQAFRVMKADSGLLVFTDWRRQEVWRAAIECAGFKIRSQGVWDKGTHGTGDLKAGFAPQHELFWFATKGRFEFPGKRPKSVIRSPRPSSHVSPHPTVKPLGLMRELCEAICPKHGLILDPFMGTGSTGVAAIQTRRSFRGMEIDPRHYSIAKTRLKAAKPE